MAILFFRVMLLEMIKQNFKKSTNFIYFYFSTLARIIEIERNIEANIRRDIVSTIEDWCTLRSVIRELVLDRAFQK